MTERKQSPAPYSPAGSEGAALVLIFVLLSLAVLLAFYREESFFLRDDLQNYFLGGYSEIVRALGAGEAPLLTPLSWQAGALAGEYQFGVFSPLQTAVNLVLFSLDLPLSHIGTSLVWIYGLILSYGTYFLARSKKLSPQLSLMAALVSSLNGWMILWGVNWIPALGSFALIPWAWLALQRTVARHGPPWSVLCAGFSVALIFTSGWPYSCLMVMLIAAMLVGEMVLVFEKPLRTAGPIVWSMLIGFGLSAPAWLMLIEYSGSTVRALAASPLTVQAEFVLPFKAYFAMIVPTLRAYWNVPWQPAVETPSTVMHLGLAPVVILAAAILALRLQFFRDLSYDWLFLLIILILASLPSLGMFRWSFRWLPLFFLQIALVAGRADSLLRRATSAGPRYGATALVLVSTVSIYSIFLERDRSQTNLWLCGGLVAVSLLWWRLESTRRLSELHRHLPWLVVFSTSMLVGLLLFKGIPYHKRQYETWEEKIFDPSITYLALYEKKHYSGVSIRVFGQSFFPGNENMHSRLRFVNGYSPMSPSGTTRTFGFNYIGAIERKPRPDLGPILQRAAVDGLVLWPGSPYLDRIPLDEFEIVARTPDFVVYHRLLAPTARVQIVREAVLAEWSRTQPGPRSSKWAVLETRGQLQQAGQPRKETVTFDPAKIQRIEEDRLSVEVEVDARATRRPALITFARPWFPGYRAYVNGETTEVMRLDRLLPAVLAPAGQKSRIVLQYRPRSLVVGLVLCGSTAVAVLLGLLLAVHRDHRSSLSRG